MKNSELIALLQQFPMETDIEFYDNKNHDFFKISGMDLCSVGESVELKSIIVSLNLID